MANTLKAKIQLRRGSYQEYLDSFIPLKGEMCLVDDNDQGLRVKIGDGVSPFDELPFEFEKQIKFGVLYENTFYLDDSHTSYYAPISNALYLDINTTTLYCYNVFNEKFQNLNAEVRQATDLQPGIMKLYGLTGNNEDGTMTQKAITENLDKKVEVSVENDTLILSVN